MSLEPLHGKAAVFGHGHHAVVEQVAVLDVVNAALGVQKFHMLLQALTLPEGFHQLAKHQPLIIVQGGGVCRVHGGKAGVPQGVCLPVQGHCSLFPIDVPQEIPTLHLEIRVAVDDLALHLEHQNGHGLVHHGTAVEHSLGVRAARRVGVGHPEGQVVISVELLGHPLQMPQVDAVAVLEHGMVVVGQCRFKHGADADGTSGGGTHPDHVMVAPLDIHMVVAHELVQYDIRPGAAVKQVPHDVQLVHSQPLDELTQPDDEPVSAAIFDDTAHDLPVIKVLVVVLKVGMEQLIQNIPAAGRQAGAHMLPGMLGGHQPADINELKQGLCVPVVKRFLIRALGFEPGQLLVGVIDERCQLCTGLFRHALPQHDVHLFPDDTRSRVQDVDKSLVFTVQVAHKMFGALGQLEQSLGADDLAGGGCLRGVIPCQQGEIFQMIPDLLVFGAHDILRPICSIFA